MWLPECDVVMIMDARAERRKYPGLRVDFIASRARGGKHGVRQWIHPVFYVLDEEGNKVDIMRETLRYGDCAEPTHVEINPSVWGAGTLQKKLFQYASLLKAAGFFPYSDECIVRNIQCGPRQKPGDITFYDLLTEVQERVLAKKQLQREQEKEEKEAAMKRREESIKFYMESIKEQFHDFMESNGILYLARALRNLLKLVDKENFNRYALMCNGTLKESKYTQELVELKKATEKIIRYTPRLAEFADAYEKSRDLVYQVVGKLGAEFGDYMLRCTIDSWRDVKDAEWYASFAYDSYRTHLRRISQP